MPHPLPKNSSKPLSPQRVHRFAAVLPTLIVYATVVSVGCSVIHRESKDQNKNVLKKLVERSESTDTPKKVSGTSDTNDESKNSTEKVRFAGGLMLGETDNVAFQPDEFRQTITSLIQEQQWLSLKQTIGLYPDLAMNLLMEADGENVSWSHATIAARILDLNWNLEGTDSWQAYIEQASASSGKTANHYSRRAKFLELLSHDELNDAINLKLTKTLASDAVDLARADALRLEGIAYLMQEEHEQSINLLDQAYQLVKESHPYFASHVGLMLGEAHRHAAHPKQWKTNWQSAVEIQSGWFSQTGITDPTFWKRAAFLRPLDTEWPAATIERLKKDLAHGYLEQGALDTTANEAIVWAFIGRQSLLRHESQNSILAYKKSESLVTNKSLRDEIQIQQAVAMIDGGQAGPASAILISLGSGESVSADRARAILASLKLQNGSLAQGMNLLQNAIQSSHQWPTSERLRAQADLGLALLMREREQEGIKLLNDVHEQFLQEKDFAQAQQCLWNIAKYYESTGKHELHATALSRINEFQNSL